MLCFKLLALIVIWLMGFAYGQLGSLPPDELNTLEEIAKILGKTDWDFSKNPCSGVPPWVTLKPVEDQEYQNEVRCYCINATCHVTEIILKGQNLNGSLPRQLSKLHFLQKIDLTRNYLNGTIPSDWASLNLTHISLVGNRITGSLPKELANILTLQNLTLDFNQLSGPIPREFGNFRQIDRLLLTSNNLTGELPDSLSNLETLSDFRISDNNLRGSIPNFIQKWVNIGRLEIQASGLSGPIPSNIASLASLTDLRISDLHGNNESNLQHYNLSSLTKLETLILRNCNIVGELPPDIGNMGSLKRVLDLSFNKLTGQIPPLSKTKNIYLTGNSLTGDLPLWMQNSRNIDLSYNNLKPESLRPSCDKEKLNLYAADSGGNTSTTISCLPTSCKNDNYYFHINCGGRKKKVGEYVYEDDTNPGGESTMFLQRDSNWGFSSTGQFLNDDRPSKTYIPGPNNIPTLSEQDTSIYMNARASSLSLTYFGFCLINGNYSVKLHFAEIMFTNDATYRSLGRRIFDVYIQGVLVESNFNIESRAGGVNKEYIYNFTAHVTNHILEIRFYWAGKGTTGIPHRGEYGPLISAISVIKPDYTPPTENGNNISAGAIVGIVIAVALFTVFLVLGILRYLKGKGSMRYDLKGIDLHTGLFSLRQIKAATNNFNPANKIGEGGFGPVYKGVLLDGTIIAVKQLSSKSQQGNREFVNEIGMISALQHPHLVKLYGCCIESNQLLLVYEYLENNSLARALFGPEEQQLDLDWPTRHMICIGIARGLAYLHEESRLKIVHRDIKATNVLLDKNCVPKISDFGLAKLDDEDNTHISTRIAGTFGYMAPEYAMRGYLTDKADVYSFGVVLLEVVSGRSNTSIRPKEERFYLLDWANSLKANGDVMELVDPRLGSKFKREEVLKAINVALLCTNPEAVERPSMSAVVSMLLGGAAAAHFDNINTTEMEMATMEVQSISMDVPWTASTSDLYPITLDTEYWEKRDP